jgi:hypothetical protein
MFRRVAWTGVLAALGCRPVSAPLPQLYYPTVASLPHRWVDQEFLLSCITGASSNGPPQTE